MYHISCWIGVIILAVAVNTSAAFEATAPIYLPPPNLDGEVSLEEAISQRRSVREFGSEAVSLADLAQLLWACQGITAEGSGAKGKIPLRSAPSAGGLYPLEIYAVVARVENMEPGIYHYIPGPEVSTHTLELVRQENEPNEMLARAALKQKSVFGAAVNILIFGVVERLEVIYGERAERYMWLETGHAAQNVCLQATALGLGSVLIGSFYDDMVQQFIGTTAQPLYNICIGKRIH